MPTEVITYYVIKYPNGNYFRSYGIYDSETSSTSIESAIHYCSKENAEMYLPYAPEGSKVLKVTVTLTEEDPT